MYTVRSPSLASQLLQWGERFGRNGYVHLESAFAGKPAPTVVSITAWQQQPRDCRPQAAVFHPAGSFDVGLPPSQSASGVRGAQDFIQGSAMLKVETVTYVSEPGCFLCG